MMSPEEIMNQASNGQNGSSKKKKCMIIAAIVVVLLVIIIPVAVIVPKKNAESKKKDELRVMIANTLEKESVNTDGMKNSKHYQGKALNWIFDSTNGGNMERTQQLQRYALATFYFATHQVKTLYTPNPPAWKSSLNWLTDVHECEWMGVQCTDRMKVNGIVLEENHLTGGLPADLVLLREHMETLDLTTNLLYMEASQFAPLEKMTKMKTVLMDDNYLTTTEGLPSYIGGMSDLEKLRLSYNLIAGPLDNIMFRELTKLTHLEIESNFLTGTIPRSIGTLKELVYLYMRRNSLTFDLEFIKTGDLNNLFAMWLDANNIIGTLPTELGTLGELASLSITNGTLTGTIPTEIASLTSLRRLWLYGNELQGKVPTEFGNLDLLEVLEVQRNKLTGIMPEKVCTNVQTKTYEHKSLTADCSAVTCANPGCCTHCH